MYSIEPFKSPLYHIVFGSIKAQLGYSTESPTNADRTHWTFPSPFTMEFDEIEEATGYEQGLAAEYARQETQALLDELERKKRARAVAVPTDDGRVKKRLRELGEPITLFGERAADRRARLIQLLSRRGDEAANAMEVDSEDSDEVGPWHYPVPVTE